MRENFSNLNFNNSKVSIFFLLIFALACRSCSDEVTSKTEFDAKVFNPYQSSLEQLITEKVPVKGSAKFRREGFKKINFEGAVEAIEVDYVQILPMFSSYKPDELKLRIINFPDSKTAENQIAKIETELTDKLKNSSNNHDILEISPNGNGTAKFPKVGKKIRTNKDIYWTNGSLFCHLKAEYDFNTTRFYLSVAY